MIADARHYYSHILRPGQGAEKKPKSQVELQELIRTARALLHVTIMDRLGLPQTRLKETAKHWLTDVTSYTLPDWPL